jgi:hydrogenase-4 component E
MSTELLWVLVGLGLAIVVVRRRTVGIALLAAQSLLLGAAAVADAVDAHEGLLVAATVLVTRGVLLPGLLLLVVRGTREPRRVRSEGPALPRLIFAVTATILAVTLIPSFDLDQAGAEHATAALVVLGIVIAAVRRPVVFQVIGFLVAENGIYLAGLTIVGGIPAAIELALLFDVVAVLGVAAAFGAKIHEHFGSSDTSLLRGLRD